MSAAHHTQVNFAFQLGKSATRSAQHGDLRVLAHTVDVVELQDQGIGLPAVHARMCA